MENKCLSRAEMFGHLRLDAMMLGLHNGASQFEDRVNNMNLLARQRPLVDGADVNRRRVSRYSVQAPVTFTWSEGEQPKTGDGWTRDLNGKGAYVYSSSLPPVGSQLKVQIILPPLGEAGRILNIHFEASILRVDTRDEQTEQSGFALKSQRVVVRTWEEGLVEESPDTNGGR